MAVNRVAASAGGIRPAVTRLWCVPLLWLALLTPGCTSLGARALKGERVHLNATLQQPNDEQLLLNLVRLR